MAKQKYNFGKEKILSKVKEFGNALVERVKSNKKLYIVVAIILVIGIYNFGFPKKNTSGTGIIKTLSVNIGKGYDFAALNNSGKSTGNKIKLTVVSAEKTNQVLVNDKTFTAKNNKLFLILNLELKNIATQPMNILPGDLIRLSYNNDEDNKFAADLHNNLVPVAAISTKLDRVGFVIPEDARNFKIFVGELEGKKEDIEINFPS